MVILIRKLLRELRHTKLRSLFIILTLSLSIAIYSGLVFAYKDIEASYTYSEEEAKFGDFRVNFDGYESTSILNDLTDEISNIESYDYRIWQPTALKIQEEYFTTYVHGIEDDRRPRVNDLYISKGEYFSGIDLNEVLVESRFAQAKDLEVNDTLEIFNGIDYDEFTVRAIVWSPEYTYVTNRLTLLPDWENLGVVWIPIFKAQTIFNVTDSFNELLVRVSEEIQLDTTIQDMTAYFHNDGKAIAITKFSENPDNFMKYQDLKFMNDMGLSFGFTVLVVAVYILWNTTNRFIEEQRNNIGVISSLGGTKWRIAFHYGSYSIVLWAIASILGLGFTFAVAEILEQSILGVLEIPVEQKNLSGSFPYFILSAAVGLVLTFLVSFLTALQKASITLRESIASPYELKHYSKKSFFERTFVKILRRLQTSVRISMRSLNKYKLKGLWILIIFGISMFTAFSSIGFANSYLGQLDFYYSDIEKQDISVYMANPINDTQLISQLEELEYVTKAEAFINKFIQIIIPTSNKSLTAQLYGFNPLDELRDFNTKNGKEITKGNLSQPNVYLGSILAKELAIEVGSQIKVGDKVLFVDDILEELMDQEVIVHYTIAQQLFDLEELATGALVKVTDINKGKEEILSSDLPVSFYLVKSETYDSFHKLISAIVVVVNLTSGFRLILLGIFSFNMVRRMVRERESEFVTLRILGSGNWTLYKIIGTHILTIALLGTLIGIPLGLLGILRFNNILVDVMFIKTYLKPNNFLIAISVNPLASIFGIWAAVRYIRRLKLADVTKGKSLYLNPNYPGHF